MPSSGPPNAFRRTLQRFFYRGMSLLPQDALPEGKVAWSYNMRAYQEGTVGPRPGLTQLTASADSPPSSIHSLFRLNDTTPFAASGASARRIRGTGTVLEGGTPGVDTYNVIDAGPYSGNPMTALVAQPIQSPRPFLYVADEDRMRKVNSDFNDYPWGIAQPTTAPTAVIAAPEVSLLNVIGVATYVTYGANTTGLTTPQRINTTIAAILYDDGATGWCSIAPADFSGIVRGLTVDVGASPSDTVVIQEVLPPIAPTTIAAILYDSGTSGLCTILPTGGLSLGQLEVALPEEVQRRYPTETSPYGGPHGRGVGISATGPINPRTPTPTAQETGRTAVPRTTPPVGSADSATPRLTVTRTIDFPVNALVTLNSAETVRILSIAVGPDGIESFRCSTSGTFSAGQTITGVGSFRAYTPNTWVATDPLTADAISVVVTPAAADTAEVGGAETAIASIRDWGIIETRGTQPEDIIRLGVKVDLLSYVEAVRILLNVSDDDGHGGADFQHNYYFYEWRASDLIDAIQAASEASAGLVSDAQKGAVERGQTDQQFSDEYGYGGPTGRGTGFSGGIIRRTQLAAAEEARSAIPRDAPVSTSSALSRQLALGNDSWLTLECRVGDLVRVGTATELTLSDINGAVVYAQINGIASAVTVQIADPYLTGGYGPDCGRTLPPYVWAYSYRSSITGEQSNPSPPMRAGLAPNRMRVVVSAPPSGAPQCDLIDYWRFGGGLARWTYVGTQPNDGNASPPQIDFNDDMADDQIDGGSPMRLDLYQPWPTQDIPRTGTCRVVGTSVQWISGHTFNTGWAPNSAIIINGRVSQLYGSPTSTTRLEVVHNMGSGDPVTFTLPNPTKLAQPLPAVWGGMINNTWFNFACADPDDPGTLHWSNGNDPDSTNDANTLSVTSASEPLLMGFFDDGVPYVFSTKRLFRILPTFGESVPFRAVETACTKGLWSRWALAVRPEGGCYFLADDGIYLTIGGGEAQSITEPDLRVLFPQDGVDPEFVRNLYPVDMARIDTLKLTVVGMYLYFDYQDTNGSPGEGRTLVFDSRDGSWTPDAYLESADSPPIPVGITARLSEGGPQVYTHILGGADGLMYQMSDSKITDVLLDINWAVWTVWAHGDDPRQDKQWGDAILDMHPGSSTDGIVVTPVVDNGNVALAAQTLGAGGTVRDTFIVEVGANNVGTGYGVISRNFGMWIEGALQACDVQRPLLYLWEPAFLYKETTTARRATDWDDLGYKGAKFVQGVVIRANTFGVAKSVLVQYDGVNASPQTGVTLSVDHNGERSLAYPLAAAGWTPFIAELVRLKGNDDVEWSLMDWRFVFEPAPELATQWQTQYTTFDFPGFLHVYDMVVGLQSTAQVNLTVQYENGPSGTYAVASTSGNYRRPRVLMEADKGKAVRFIWTSNSPFRLFKTDCAVRVQAWGAPGGYRTLNPFGGPHRIDGAGI